MDAQTREQINRFKEAMKKKSIAVEDDTGKAVLAACVLVEKTAKLGMKTTQLDTSKSYKVTKTKYHYPSQEWDYPAIDTGRLWQSITHDISKHYGVTIGRVGTNVGYGAMLEHGTSKMVPRPWLGSSIAFQRDRIREIFKGILRGESPDIEIN